MNIIKKSFAVFFTIFTMYNLATVGVLGDGNDGNSGNDSNGENTSGSSETGKSAAPSEDLSTKQPHLRLKLEEFESGLLCDDHVQTTKNSWERDFSLYSIVWFDSSAKADGANKPPKKDPEVTNPTEMPEDSSIDKEKGEKAPHDTAGETVKLLTASTAKSEEGLIAKPDVEPTAKPDVEPTAKPDVEPTAKTFGRPPIRRRIKEFKAFYRLDLHKIGKTDFTPPKFEIDSSEAEEKEISEGEFRSAILKITDTLRGQPGIIEIRGYTAVIGDVHGDFKTLEQLISILSCCLNAGEIDNVLFLGDILDRGPSSARTLNSLIKFFYKYAGHVYLIKGNHETMDQYKSGARYIGAACREPLFQKLGDDIVSNFFDSLPYAAIVNENTLAVHGGIPYFIYWKDFWEGKKVPERDVANFTAIRGALWSDYKEDGNGITANSCRGFGPGGEAVYYNEEVVETFFSTLNEKMFSGSPYNSKYFLSYLIRGHQIFLAPFCQSPNGVVTTVFSAINGQDFAVRREGAGVAVLTPTGLPPMPYIIMSGS